MTFIRRRPLFCALLLLFGVGLLAAYGVRLALPPIFRLADYEPMQASHVYAHSGERIGTFALERRTVVPFEALPAHTVHAFLAAEDAEFYSHEGIDWLGVARALVKNMRPGAHLQGASTITQQTVKTLVLGPERSLWRKLKEAILARRLEQLLPKDEILALYLNQIYFGNGAWGIEEASQTYFGKTVSDLTLAESALLAGIPKNPSRYTLKGDRRAAKRRQGYVLRQMVAHVWATPAEADAAAALPLPSMPEAPGWLHSSAAYVEHVRRLLSDTLGDERLNTAGLRIYTHLDVAKQQAAADSIAQSIDDVARRHGYTGAPGHLTAERFTAGVAALHKAFEALAENYHAGVEPEAKLMWDLRGLGAAPTLFGANVLREMRVVPLLPFARTRALVARLPAAQNEAALIDLGGGQMARLPLMHMAWARPYSPTVRTRRPLRPADVLRVGDLITVEVQPGITGLAHDAEAAITVALVPEPKVEGALVAMVPPYGAVQAMVGGRDPTQATGFNRATQARRQPGSAFKPVLYAAGLQTHAITPASICSDSPVVIVDPYTQATWKPENYEDGRYDGSILYRTALARSKNTCSVRLLQKVGLDATAMTAQAMGIDAPLPHNLTVSLGTGEVTPLMMAQVMHTIANGGLNVAPRFIERVLDRRGAQVPWAEPAANRAALTPDVAYVLTSMMRSVVENGTARRAQVLGRPLAAKTGTSQLSRDAWLVGFAPTLAATVWLGLDDDTSMGQETGGSAALPAWVRFMGLAMAGEPVVDFAVPAEVHMARIDPVTGLASDDPTAVVEVFVAGTEPEASAAPLQSIFLEDDDGN